MFNNKKTKIIKNSLMRVSIPKNYQKSTVNMAAELAAIEGFNREFCAAGIIIRLVSSDEIHAMQGDGLMEKYLQWVSRPEGVTVRQDADVELAGFKGVSLTFDKRKVDLPQEIEIFGEGRVMESHCVCLQINTEFCLDIMTHYDSRRKDHMQAELNDIVESFSLDQAATLEVYQELTAKELTEAEAIRKALEDDDTAVIDSWANEEHLETSVQETAPKKQRRKKIQAMLNQLIEQHQLVDVSHFMADSANPKFSFECKVRVNGVLSRFVMDIDEDTDINLFGAEADALFTDINEVAKRSKRAIVDEFLDIYNTSWTDEELGRHEISAEQFFAELSEPFISIDSEETSFTYGTKNDLFSGHSLCVEYAFGTHFKKPHPTLIG